jgi:hypothetical protein
VLFLSAPTGASDLYVDMHSPKLYSTPAGVQQFTHVIEPHRNKIVFIPAHLPWGFTTNTATTDTMVFCNSFIIKKS